MTSDPLRIGYVPEHYSVPLHFAVRHYGLQAMLVPFPAGTGHMIAALRDNTIDMAVGLTEAWIAGLGRGDMPGDGGYRLVGTYVTSPLCWRISAGIDSPHKNKSSLKGTKIGVSRIGSGSHIIGTVFADQQGWLELAPEDDKPAGGAYRPSPVYAPPYAATVELGDFASLRSAVSSGVVDFFLWEKFTTIAHDAALPDGPRLRRLGDIRTPWSSWKVVASTRLARTGPNTALVDTRVADMLERLDRGVARLGRETDEVVALCVDELGYREGDVREWLGNVRFAERTAGVDLDVVRACVDTLKRAGVLAEGDMDAMKPEEMVVNV